MIHPGIFLIPAGIFGVAIGVACAYWPFRSMDHEYYFLRHRLFYLRRDEITRITIFNLAVLIALVSFIAGLFLILP